MLSSRSAVFIICSDYDQTVDLTSSGSGVPSADSHFNIDSLCHPQTCRNNSFVSDSDSTTYLSVNFINNYLCDLVLYILIC